MKTNELVWLTLADAALTGRREWPDLSTLAAAVDAPVSSTHQALGRGVDIGAIQPRRRGGVVVSPDRVLLTLAVNRNLIRDTIAVATLNAAQSLTSEHPSAVAIGGTDAGVHWLGGVNTIADKGVRLIYGETDVAQGLAEGDEVRVVSRDRVAARAWRTGSRASSRRMPTCSRCPAGRRASSGSRFIPGASIVPTGINPHKTCLPEPTDDSDETIRRVLDHVGATLIHRS